MCCVDAQLSPSCFISLLVPLYTCLSHAVLCDLVLGKKKPCVFVSHRLSDQATRLGGGIGTLRFCLRSCLREESCSLPTLVDFFAVRTDHKNLVCLAHSTVTKLVRWRWVLLSEFGFQVEHIPGAQNVVSDGLTRIFKFDLNCRKRSDIASRRIQMSNMKFLEIPIKKRMK